MKGRDNDHESKSQKRRHYCQNYFCHNLRSTARRNYITYRMASWAECRKNQTPETEITNNAPPADNSNLPPVTEQPLDEDGQSVWTSTDGVNFRAEPNTDSEILTVLVTGTKLTLLGEENGWVQAEYNGQKGYVSSDYVTDQKPDTTTQETE